MGVFVSTFWNLNISTEEIVRQTLAWRTLRTSKCCSFFSVCEGPVLNKSVPQEDTSRARRYSEYYAIYGGSYVIEREFPHMVSASATVHTSFLKKIFCTLSFSLLFFLFLSISCFSLALFVFFRYLLLFVTSFLFLSLPLSLSFHPVPVSLILCFFLCSCSIQLLRIHKFY